jgi:hypothetical protein
MCDARCNKPAVYGGYCVSHRHNYITTCANVSNDVRCSEMSVVSGLCFAHWQQEQSKQCRYVSGEHYRCSFPAELDGYCLQHNHTFQISNNQCGYWYLPDVDGIPHHQCRRTPVRQGYCQIHHDELSPRTPVRSTASPSASTPTPSSTPLTTSQATKPTPVTEPTSDEEEETAAVQQDCTICMDKKRNAVFVPCGHMAACYKCSVKVKDVCPICRVTIKSVTKVYL